MVETETRRGGGVSPGAGLLAVDCLGTKRFVVAAERVVVVVVAGRGAEGGGGPVVGSILGAATRCWRNVSGMFLSQGRDGGSVRRACVPELVSVLGHVACRVERARGKMFPDVLWHSV